MGDGNSGSVSAALPDAGHEERFERLVRAWWLDERPEWTEQSWWDVALRADVRSLLWLPAGPDLAARVAALERPSSCPLPHDDDRLLPAWPTPGHEAGWPCACQVVMAAAWEACAAWTAAGAASALVDAAGREGVQFTTLSGQQLHDPAREELAHGLRSSVPSMGNRIAAARALVAHPALVDLVATGAISSWAARLVLDHVKDLGIEPAARIVDRVVHRVRDRLASGRGAYNAAEVGRIARRARLAVSPEEDRSARVRAFGGRRVAVQQGSNGMATLIADLAECDAHRIHRRLSAIARGLEQDARADGQPEQRSRDQIRADVLVDVVLGDGGRALPLDVDLERAKLEATDSAGRGRAVADAGSACIRSAGAEVAAADVTRRSEARRSGVDGAPGRPETHVVVSLSTLLGLTDEPAEVPGLGPIPADVARELAADGRWSAWVTGATGIVTATGSRGYVPSEPIARLVRARHPHCRFPGCRQAAMRCDLDHAIPWPRGATTAANLGPLCRRHHLLKTHAGWSLEPGVASTRRTTAMPPEALEPDLSVADPSAADPSAADPSAADSAMTDASVVHSSMADHPEIRRSLTDPHGDDPHGDDPSANETTLLGWRWRTPAGFTILDEPSPPLQ